MKLLLRFMQPTGGALMVNGRSLLEIPPELWRNQVAFVSQHPHFFEGSVFDNLRTARPGFALGGADVEFVLSRGCLAKSIERSAFAQSIDVRTHFEAINPEVRTP